MTAWLIITIIAIWFGLPTLLIVCASIHSSRMSQAEEAAGIVVERPINSSEPCNDKDAIRNSPPVRVPTIRR